MQSLVVLITTALVGWSSGGFKQVLRSLRSNQARYFGLFAKSPVAILVVSSDRRVEYANPSAIALLSADPIGRTVNDLKIIGLSAALDETDSERPHGVVQLEEGNHRVEIATTRLSLPDGWQGWQVQLHDLAEIDRAQRALKATREQLIQAQRMESLGRLAGGISHDFNNLLSVVTANTSLLSEDLSEEDQELTTEILDASARAAQLARQLMDLGRNDRLDAEFFDPVEVIERYAPMLRRMVGPGVTVEAILPPDAGLLLMDPGQLEQVLSNLAINASHAMEGQGTLTTELRSTPQGLVIRLQDSGSGMTPETAARIFEPFYTTKDRDHGTGLGLAVVKGIIQQAGGTVKVESTLGEGSCFTLTFPEHAVEPTWTPGPGRLDLSRWDLSGISLLIVDHDQHNREEVHELLKLSGATVHATSSPSDALQRDDLHSFHLLVVEMDMPGLSGRALIQKLRERSLDMPALIRTSTYEQRTAQDTVTMVRGVAPGVLLQTCARLATLSA